MKLFELVALILVAHLCSSSAQVTLEQAPPVGSLCLGDVVTFTCTVQNHLVWTYNNDERQESKPFSLSDSVYDQKDLGPFQLTLVSKEGGSTVGSITSTAMITGGVTKDEKGTMIKCVGNSSLEITITFAVPNITDVTFCMNTISWNPPLCDANCTVSVDGQDIATVPCKNGKLDSSVSNLSSKMVVIVATDGVDQNTSTALSMEDCSGFEGMSSAMTMSSTESPSTEGGIQAGVIVGIVLVVLLVAGVVVGLAIGIVMYLWCQHSKKEGTDHNQYRMQDLDDDYKILTVDDQIPFKDCHQHPITHCAISPDARYAATADSSMVVRFWDITLFTYHNVIDNGTFDELIEGIKERKKKAPYILLERKFLLSLNWISQGEGTKLVLTYNSGVIIWNTSNGDIVTLYEAKPGGEDSWNASMLCTACSPDATFALSYTTDLERNRRLGYLVIGNYDELHQQKRKTLSEQEFYILCMSFSPTGKRLVTGNINGKIRIYTNVSNRSGLAYSEWKAHTGRVHDVQFGSEDEKNVYSLGQDECFCLWDSSTIGAPLTKIHLEGYQHPRPLTEFKLRPFLPDKRIPHPGIGQSKLFGCCFAYKYILISSMDGKVLYKIDADCDLKHLERKLSVGPVSCLDCMTTNEGECTICILGSTNNSVHFVRLRCGIEFEESVPETDDGKPRTATTFSVFEEMESPIKERESRQRVPANTMIKQESVAAL